MDDREKYGLATEIVHLFRTFVSRSHGPNAWNRRKGGDGFAYQGFNYPKSVWGGQLKSRIRGLEGDDRAAAYKLMGGTNTPRRRRWQQQMREGRINGWYRTLTGTVEQMRLDQGMVVSQVKTAQGGLQVSADFVIDCTGLEADIAEHRVLADLLAHTGAGRNPLGRLDVERTFELRGAASEPRGHLRFWRHHARRLLSRSRHLSRAPDRGPGNYRRPRPARFLRSVGAAQLHPAMAAVGAEPAALTAGVIQGRQAIADSPGG